MEKADIGIAVADATDAARSASDIVLTEPGLNVTISAVLTSRAIFQRIKNYTIFAVSITTRIVVGLVSCCYIYLIWEFDFPPFMVLIIAILNDGTIMTISKDRVELSPLPDSWKLAEIFATGIILVKLAYAASIWGVDTIKLLLIENNNISELNQLAEEAKRRAERLLSNTYDRLRELHTLKGHVESVVRVKGLDIYTIQQAYTTIKRVAHTERPGMLNLW
ncbi:hypothetical protein OROMI_020938 [Orobanche minor]